MSAPPTSAAVGELAAAVHRLLREQGSTLAVAESLTGGLLGAVLTDVPGASVSFRGGVVAYASELKTRLLDVPAPLLDRHGAVHPDVALAMARGVRTRLGATWGLATTGVAGPDPQDGRPPGTVHVALAGPTEDSHAALELTGDRTAVRAGTVRAALELALAGLRAAGPGPEALA